jgi:hypothetical protein
MKQAAAETTGYSALQRIPSGLWEMALGRLLQQSGEVIGLLLTGVSIWQKFLENFCGPSPL